jgi:hypothetical protein
MPRKVVVRKDEIYMRRASAWEAHYSLRGAAVGMISVGFNVGVLIPALKRELPAPCLDVDGYSFCLKLDDRVKRAGLMRRFSLANEDQICLWYWSHDGWMEFVRAFQGLPEPMEDYYYTYELATDRNWLVPVSTARRGRRAVGKPVDNKGATRPVKVQVGQFERVLLDAKKGVDN